MRKYRLNERMVGGLKIGQTPSSKTRVNGLISSWWLEMRTVTNGLLWRYCSVSSSTAHMRRQNVHWVDFQTMQTQEVWLLCWLVELQFRNTTRHWKSKQKNPFWGFCFRNFNKCKILHLGRKKPNAPVQARKELAIFQACWKWSEGYSGCWTEYELTKCSHHE